MKRRVLIADNDAVTRRMLSQWINDNGFQAIAALGVEDGFARLSSDCPDIMLLDVSSSAVLSRLKAAREWAKIPIIAMSSDVKDLKRVEALNHGADIFIEKPLSPSEVIAYLRVCDRRLSELEERLGHKTVGTYKKGALEIDPQGNTVLLGGRIVHLTANELKILLLLCRHNGRVLSYDFIMNSVWGPRGRSGNGLLRVNITNIRRKIERDAENPEYLFTENGIGYRLAAAD